MAAIMAAIILVSCHGRSRLKANDASESILINQVGYRPDASKVALVRTDDTIFSIIDVTTGNSLFKGGCGEKMYWSYSGDSVRKADFSALNTPGNYRVTTGDNNESSYAFSIYRGIYTNLAKAVAKAFYYNRCSFDIDNESGTIWARKSGHPDTAVIVHSSAASDEHPEGSIISSPGGWYDAGDYNKYVVNSSITVYTMLLAYQLYPEYCRSLKTDIPESDNDIPDIADEILYNLKWMLTMQDQNDGGVYHKLTNKHFNAFEMPEVSTEPRYVVMKSTAATLDFAAVMAMASRVFRDEEVKELRDLASTCRRAALSAMEWATRNPNVIFRNPEDISTGEYGDTNLSDELFWAKAELAATTGNSLLLTKADFNNVTFRTPSWSDVGMLGIYSLALSENDNYSPEISLARTILKEETDKLIAKYNESAYNVSIDYFHWGSNSDVANQGMMKLVSHKLSDDDRYRISAQADLDYILGRNATGYCFVTGIGSLSPMHIHHRLSGADGVEKPLPGFLVGGPNLDVLNDCMPPVPRSPFPAKSYTDSECSYSTNEIAINWNAPLLFITVALEN